MMQYLRWFDSQMTKPTLLLIDGFSAHKLAVSNLKVDEEQGSLRHTKVMWLPSNATSVHQSLDQGIIQN